MLRFSFYRSDDGEQWKLCGELSGPWVDELRLLWNRIRERGRRTRAMVDLRDVTFIDESGAALLAEMQRTGAEFVAKGVDHKHLIANLNGRGGRAVRRKVEYLKAASGAETSASADGSVDSPAVTHEKSVGNANSSGARQMESEVPDQERTPARELRNEIQGAKKCFRTDWPLR